MVELYLKLKIIACAVFLVAIAVAFIVVIIKEKRR